MAYREAKNDLVTVQKDIERVFRYVMSELECDFHVASEFLFLPLTKEGGRSTVELVRLGYSDRALNAVQEIIRQSKLRAQHDKIKRSRKA